ncbi:MAG: GIY-YIG nuclease family protein [Schwartzia sp.]|nr:GIY-YIG nuclease family protein [Schwartzia sp. (in: firmicutes)]
MPNAKAKTINLLLYEGDLDGVISIEDSSWNSGELYCAPRDSVADLLETDACKKYGVYLLLSKDKVYIGQSSDLAKRITQHTIGKDWWQSVVILTTKDDSLTHSDIDYLESVLIGKAFKIHRLDCDNKNKGNNPKVSKFQKIVLEQYLEEALFLMKLIGISVFSDKPTGTLINTIDTKTKLAIGKRTKKTAISFLEEKGVPIGQKATYAVKKEEKNEFWVNPNKELLQQEWWLILNNTASMELIVLKIPRNSLVLEKDGLQLRTDRPELIDLHIHTDTLKDRRSGVDFAPFVIKRIKYND